jgi:hypothetical protein
VVKRLVCSSRAGAPDKTRQATLISEHSTAVEASREIDRLAAQMVRTGAPNDAVELVVVDAKLASPDDPNREAVKGRVPHCRRRRG